MRIKDLINITLIEPTSKIVVRDHIGVTIYASIKSKVIKSIEDLEIDYWNCEDPEFSDVFLSIVTKEDLNP